MLTYCSSLFYFSSFLFILIQLHWQVSLSKKPPTAEMASFSSQDYPSEVWCVPMWWPTFLCSNTTRVRAIYFQQEGHLHLSHSIRSSRPVPLWRESYHTLTTAHRIFIAVSLQLLSFLFLYRSSAFPCLWQKLWAIPEPAIPSLLGCHVCTAHLKNEYWYRVYDSLPHFSSIHQLP